MVSGVVYVVSDQSDAVSDSAVSDSISWGKILLGVLLPLLAAQSWRNRPVPGIDPGVPRWMQELKGWLGAHNAVIMAVLFLVLGVNLIAKGIPA